MTEVIKEVQRRGKLQLVFCKDSFVWGYVRFLFALLGSEEAEVSHDSFSGPVGMSAAIHRPIQCSAERLAQDRPTGFADGRQLPERPFIRMALPQLSHQEAVRQHDEVHVPGLALAVTQLTSPHAQLLLAIPMKGLCACPTMPIGPHHPRYLPLNPVRHQHDT